MPRPDDATRLRHILDSARKVVHFIDGRTREDFDTNELLALALVRLLEVIDEAATGVSEELRGKYPDIPWRQMMDTRNRLIHGYFDIDTTLVWETATKELPLLIIRISKVIDKEGF